MNQTAPYEQQPAESVQAFAAFVVYRDMGATRSLVRVSQEHGKSIATLSKWSTVHNWVDRSRSYDAMLDARARAATEGDAIERRRKMLDEHAEQAHSLMTVGKRLMAEFERRFGDKGTLQWIDGSDFIKMIAQLPKIIETAQKLERLAMGEPSENIAPPIPFDDMTEAQLVEYIERVRAITR